MFYDAGVRFPGRSSADIPDDELRRLYCDEGISTAQIARQLGWSETAVRNRLIALGIPRRTPWARNAVDCKIDELRRLYVDEGLSTIAIAKQYRCSDATILRKLVAAGIERREDCAPRYARTDFSGDPAEKANLIGFRLGDLNVELKADRTVLVKCTSTRAEQVQLFRQMLGRYGHVFTDEATVARRKRQSIGMQIGLNLTFEFLLPKQDAVPDWILTGNDEVFFAFFAGYVDAEGYVKTYRKPTQSLPQAQLELRPYDSVILTQLGAQLCFALLMH